MRAPIRYQFMLPMLLVAAASLVGVGIVNAWLATTRTTARIEEQLRGVVRVLSESTYPLTDSVLRQMAGLAHAEFLLTDENGERIASSSPLHLPESATRASTIATVDDVRLGAPVLVGSTPMRHSAVRLQRRSPPSRPQVLHVLFAKTEYDAAWRLAFLPPLLVGTVTVAAMAVVTHMVARRISGSLGRLGREVRRLAEGDFSEVTVPTLNDETRDLALSVNQTTVRLAEYEAEVVRTERLRTVAMLGAGLAHEIRNAATGCRLAVDLHAERCGGDGGVDDSLAIARRQLTLMEGRLKQVLQLGQEPSPTDLEAVNLGNLITDSLDLMRPSARHARIRIEWTAPSEPFVVQGNTEVLGQAVTNVLLNALDAAAKAQAAGGAEGVVSVLLQGQQQSVELIVSDSGDGPSAEVSDTVFEPLVTAKPEGAGLGLAVAKQAVESFGGRIGWARSSGLTEFRLYFPRMSAGVTCG